MRKHTLCYDTFYGFLDSVNLRTVEYRCSAVYLGRTYRHEQSDIAYQGLLLSAQRIVERPGVKLWWVGVFLLVFVWFFISQYEMLTTRRWWTQLPCLFPRSLHSSLPFEDGQSKHTYFSVSYFWTVLRPDHSYFTTCYSYFSTIPKHLTTGVIPFHVLDCCYCL